MCLSIVKSGGTLNYFCCQRETIDWYEYLRTVRPKLSDSLIDEYTKVRQTDLDYLHRVVKADSLLWGFLPQAAAENLRLVGVDTSSARSLDAYEELIDQAIKKIAQDGAVGLKSTASTWRTLSFPSPDLQLAEAAIETPIETLPRESIVAFENFAFGKIMESAGRYGLPVQIHTGTGYGPGGTGGLSTGRRRSSGPPHPAVSSDDLCLDAHQLALLVRDRAVGQEVSQRHARPVVVDDALAGGIGQDAGEYVYLGSHQQTDVGRRLRLGGRNLRRPGPSQNAS